MVHQMEFNIPVPLEGLGETRPTAFLTKTYNIVEDSSTNNIVSWSRDNNSFIIWEPETFALICLPRCFKHNNFSSFVRQLNTYGFKKVNTERWEFSNEYFLKGQRNLLKNIKRRKTSSSQTHTQSLKGGRVGPEGEIEELRSDRVALVLELERLRRKQETMKTYLHSMQEKLKVTEVKQEMMMDFLLKKIKKPSFFKGSRKCKMQGFKNRERRKEVHETIVKAEPEEYLNDTADQYRGVFAYGDELHIASLEDQGQEGDEMETDSEGIWKGFVLSEEMCD